jgi:hypothetical protein
VQTAPPVVGEKNPISKEQLIIVAAVVVAFIGLSLYFIGPPAMMFVTIVVCFFMMMVIFSTKGLLIMCVFSFIAFILGGWFFNILPSQDMLMQSESIEYEYGTSTRTIIYTPAGDPSTYPVFTKAKLKAKIKAYSREFDVSVHLMNSLITQESAGDQNAISSKGARGLMQIMLATGKDQCKKLIKTKNDLYHPERNLRCGFTIYKRLLRKYKKHGHKLKIPEQYQVPNWQRDKTIILALCGYNAGEGAVKRGGGCPRDYTETIDYVKRITGKYRRALQQYSGLNFSEQSLADTSFTTIIYPTRVYKHGYGYG